MSLKLAFVSLASCGLALLLALAPGYPTGVPSVPGSRAAQLVHSLNQALQSVDSELERLRLVGACQLRLRPVDAEPIQLDLMSASVRMDADERTGDLQLFLRADPAGRGLLLLATDSWPLWSAAHSDFNQLRALCARQRNTSR